MNLVAIGHWAFVLGLIISIIAGLITGFGREIPVLVSVLVVLGLIVGFLIIPEKESTPFLIGVIALLVIGLASLETIKYVAWLIPILNNAPIILNNVTTFVAAAGLVVAVKQVLTIAKKGSEK